MSQSLAAKLVFWGREKAETKVQGGFTVKDIFNIPLWGVLPTDRGGTPHLFYVTLCA
jgi:hypothetical protein